VIVNQRYLISGGLPPDDYARHLRVIAADAASQVEEAAEG